MRGRSAALVRKLRRVDADQEDLVEAGTVTHDSGQRLHGVADHLRSIHDKMLHQNLLSLALSESVNEHVALLRAGLPNDIARLLPPCPTRKSQPHERPEDLPE